MAKQKTTKSKKSSSKVTKGTGGLQLGKQPRKWLVVTLVLVVAIAGGLLVWDSFAAVNRSTASQGRTVHNTYRNSRGATIASVLGRAAIHRHPSSSRPIASGVFNYRNSRSTDYRNQRIETRLYKNGRLVQFKSCPRSNLQAGCVITGTRGSGTNSYTSQTRYCGDHKRDSAGLLCTSWSVALIRY